MSWPDFAIPVGILALVFACHALLASRLSPWKEAELRWRNRERGEKLAGRFYQVGCLSLPEMRKGLIGIYGEIYSAGILLLPGLTFRFFLKPLFVPWECLSEFRTEPTKLAFRVFSLMEKEHFTGEVLVNGQATLRLMLPKLDRVEKAIRNRPAGASR